MNIEIIKILDRGVPKKERIWLKAKARVNLSYYGILKTEYIGDNEINNDSSSFTFLPNKTVNIGDSIIIYTKKGTESSNQKADNTYNHFLYWGHDNVIFNNQDDCVVLLELNYWETSKRGQ